MSTQTAAAVTLTIPSKPRVNATNHPDVVAAIARFKELKAIESAGAKAKKEREELEATVLRPFIGGSAKALAPETEVIVRGVVAARVSSLRHNNHTDKELLQEAFPEAYAATLVDTPYTFITAS